MIYNWSKMINRALWLYTQRAGITYCLECAGEVAGRDKAVENRFKYYYGTPEWHDKIGHSCPGWEPTDSADTAWKKWLTVNNGKMCFDCSGYIDWCMGFEGIHKYSSWSFGGMPKQASVSQGVAGSALWREGHVGLDIGYGASLSIGSFGNSINLRMIGDEEWTSSHLITGVDYTGADAR